MDRDIDRRVNGSACTNHGSTRDDSWSSTLAAGGHPVEVYPYDPGPGDYSLTVTSTTTLPYVAQPMAGGPTAVICEEDEDGQPKEDACQDIVINDEITVIGEDPGPPPGTGPGEGDPGPGPGPAPDPCSSCGGGGGGPTPTPTPPTGPTPSGSSLAAATSDINCEGGNIDDGDGFDAPRTNSDGTTRKHRAIDVQVSSDGASFFALADGTITNYASSPTCGHQVAVSLADGGRHVYCHMDDGSRLAEGTEVSAGDALGTYGPSGVTFGPHLHLKVTDSNDRPIDPVEAAGGEDVMAAAGFTFNGSDAEHCAEE